MIKTLRKVCEIAVPVLLAVLFIVNYNKFVGLELSLLTSLIAVVICLWIDSVLLKQDSVLKIKVKYHNAQMYSIKKIKQGDWIDLVTSETIEIKKGEFKLIPLGVSVELPRGYEAYIVPRSSTFKNHKIIQTNGIGIIDESYQGDEDQWMMPVYAFEDTIILQNERVCQFRIMKKMDSIEFITVDRLNNDNRNGFGSTGE